MLPLLTALRCSSLTGARNAEQELLEQLREAAEMDDDDFLERRRIWFHDFDLQEPRGAPSPELQAGGDRGGVGRWSGDWEIGEIGCVGARWWRV